MRIGAVVDVRARGVDLRIRDTEAPHIRQVRAIRLADRIRELRAQKTDLLKIISLLDDGRKDLHVVAQVQIVLQHIIPELLLRQRAVRHLHHKGVAQILRPELLRARIDPLGKLHLAPRLFVCDDRDITAALIAGHDILRDLVSVHGVAQQRLIEIKVVEAERLERVDLLLGGVPHARAAQLQRVRQLGHDAVERGVIKRAGFLRQQVHEAERALLGHIQRNKRSVRLERLLADVERIRQILHVAGAAVEIDHVVGVVLKLRLLDRTERDHVHAALLRDRAHVTRGLDALDAAAVDHALEQAAAAADGEHALARNVAKHFLEQAELALEQVFIGHEPCVVLRRIAVKFRFHLRIVLSDLQTS